MEFYKEDIEYIAKLARLEFTEEEKYSIGQDLNKVMEYIKKLKEIDTEAVDIVINPYYMENDFREDEKTTSLDIKSAIYNAPEILEDYIKVPKVIE